MEFSRRLKKLRTEKNISQEELAKLLNVSRTSVTNYELGRNEASAQILTKLSELFNCSIDYLMGKSYYKNYEEFEELDKFALNYKRTAEESELIAKTLNYINTHKFENIDEIINNAVRNLPVERQYSIKKIIYHLHYRYHGKLPNPKKSIKEITVQDINNLTVAEVNDLLVGQLTTLDVSGLDKKDIEEIQEQIDYKRWKKQNSNEKNTESKDA